MIMNDQARTFIAVATLVAAAMLMTGYIANGDPVQDWGLAGLLFAISAGFWVWMWRDSEAESMALVVQDDAPALPKAQEWIISKDVVGAIEDAVDAAEQTDTTEEETDELEASGPDLSVDERAEVIEEVIEAADDSEVVKAAKDDDPVAEAEVAEAMAAKPNGGAAEKAEDNKGVIAEELEPDDLERIEGIGEKYKDALVAAGITTFNRLSQASLDEIEQAAADAEMRRSASMSTWAEQAALAARNDWDGLDALQEKLTGGRRED